MLTKTGTGFTEKILILIEQAQNIFIVIISKLIFFEEFPLKRYKKIHCGLETIFESLNNWFKGGSSHK